MNLTITVVEGKNGYLIGKIKEIPEVITQGKGLQEVKENILDALALYLQDSRDSFMSSNQKIIDEEPLQIVP